MLVVDIHLAGFGKLDLHFFLRSASAQLSGEWMGAIAQIDPKKHLAPIHTPHLYESAENTLRRQARQVSDCRVRLEAAIRRFRQEADEMEETLRKGDQELELRLANFA
jgi:hypothetical protein